MSYPPSDKNVRPLKKEKEETDKLVNENKPLRTGIGQGFQRIESTVEQRAARLQSAQTFTSEEHGKRDYLAAEMLSVLGDDHSLGFYRKTAATKPAQAIFDVLGLVKETSREGRIGKSKGAMFAALIRDRGQQ